MALLVLWDIASRSSVAAFVFTLKLSRNYCFVKWSGKTIVVVNMVVNAIVKVFQLG